MSVRWISTILLLPIIVLAENSSEELGFKFQRGVDYYRWDAFGGKSTVIGGENFYGYGRYYTILRQPPGYPDQWKNSLNFDALWNKPLTPDYRLLGLLNSEFFNDQQVRQPLPFYQNSPLPENPLFDPEPSGALTTGMNSRIIRQSVKAGLDMPKFFDMKIVPSAGIYGEEIQTVTSAGPAAGITVEGDSMTFGGLLSSLSAAANGQFMENRSNREISANFSAGKEYSEAASNYLSTQYRSYSREFPLTQTSAIDRRREESYGFSDNLNYRIAEPLMFSVGFNFAHRMVEPSRLDNSNRLRELSTGISAALTGRYLRHTAQLKFSSDGQNQHYPTRDIKGRQYRLDMEITSVIGEERFKLAGMLSRFKYDVLPELYSLDTRDELRHSYILTHLHAFGEGLELETQLRTDLYHLVYLKSARSADNNWERFFLFSPEIRYYSEEWSQKARFRVSADYIDYDFADVSPPSRVFRKFSAEDSLYIAFTRNWGMKTQYLLLLEDQGELNWGAFIQELSDKYNTSDLSVMLVRKVSRLEYGFGWTYYRRKAFHSYFGAELNPGETVESSGPAVSVFGRGPWKSQVELTAGYRRIFETGRSSYSQTLIDFTLIKTL